MKMRLLVLVLVVATMQAYGAAHELPALSKAVAEKVYAYQERASRASSYSALATLKGSLERYQYSPDAARAMSFDPKIIKIFNHVGADIKSKMDRFAR